MLVLPSFQPQNRSESQKSFELNQMSDDNATATKKLSFQATVKKEMNLFQSTNERSKNLNLLYMILQNISPTSVASERAFSNSKKEVQS